MSDHFDEAEKRRDEIQQILNDEIEVDRLAFTMNRRDALRERLASTMPDHMVDRAMDAKLDCIYHLRVALACCKQVYVSDGRVAFVGTRAQVFAQRIAKYNEPSKVNGMSLAAFYLKEASS